jgi:peptidoglycan/LPS O-acetylase OafA/YrhL
MDRIKHAWQTRSAVSGSVYSTGNIRSIVRTLACSAAPALHTRDYVILAMIHMARRDGRIAGEDERILAAKPSGKESSTANYYPWFDWLRLGLAFVVLLSHQGLIDAWPRAGNFAVQVFFALSGWLIGGLLVKLPKGALRRFYFNRALRIWCPYFLALGLLVAASLLRDRATAKWTEFVFYKATFVYNIFGPPQLAQHSLDMPLAGTGNHFWSVNAEEQFYLLAPLLLVLAPRRLGRSAIAWAAIAAVAWVSKTYASIMFGVLAAVVVNAYGAFHAHYRCRIAAGAVVALSALGLATGADYDLLAPVCAIALVVLLAIKGRRHPWGELAGGISYPLYLNAWVAVFMVNFVVKRIGLTNQLAHQALVIASSFGLATFLYWHVDRRILASRQQLYTPERARIATTAAYGAVALGLCVGFILYSRIG